MACGCWFIFDGIARIKKSLAAISPLRSRQTFSGLMIICEHFVRLSPSHYLLPTLFFALICQTQWTNHDVRPSSDLEDSHVIPGLIHKCYLAKSQSDFSSLHVHVGLFLLAPFPHFPHLYLIPINLFFILWIPDINADTLHPNYPIQNRKQYPLRRLWHGQAPSPIHILLRPCQIIYMDVEGVRRCGTCYSEWWVIFRSHSRLSRLLFCLGSFYFGLSPFGPFNWVWLLILLVYSWWKWRSEHQRGGRRNCQSRRVPRCLQCMYPLLSAQSLFPLLTFYIYVTVRHHPRRRSVPQTSLEWKAPGIDRRIRVYAFWARYIDLFRSYTKLICSEIALDTTVKWFIENYDNARTGKKDWY
jgi:hypothetical protein